ncbi:MAG TPA: hypothetical protein VHE79_04315, partial [Spirochaetia bacterium]
KNVDPRCAACGRAEPGKGYAPENIHHHATELWNEERGWKGLWTGMCWSAGGGLAASAYLERRFGHACVDLAARAGVGIDGLTATLESWDGRTAVVGIGSPLRGLRSPYLEPRRCRVTVRGVPDAGARVVINGRDFGPLPRADLKKGVEVTV